MDAMYWCNCVMLHMHHANSNWFAVSVSARISLRVIVSLATHLLVAILKNSWHLPSLSIRYITGHGPLTFLTMCVSFRVYACVRAWWVTWACPTDILLDANGIHLRGSWRGGRRICLDRNGACPSPVGVCVFIAQEGEVTVTHKHSWKIQTCICWW